MNSAELKKWFLIDMPCTIGGLSITTESLFDYFVLPTEKRAQLFGHTYNDSRADLDTTEFTDGHRIHTGDLVFFTPTQATTQRTVYKLDDIHPAYAAWLSSQGYDITNAKINY